MDNNALANRLDTLQNQVANTTDVGQSVIVLCEGIAREILASGGDRYSLETIANKLTGDSGAISAAVVANTSAPQRTMAAGYRGSEQQPPWQPPEPPSDQRRKTEEHPEPVGSGRKK